MKIFFHEIKDQDTHLSFSQNEPWVRNTVLKLDEELPKEFAEETNGSSLLRPSSKKAPQCCPPDRPIETRFSLRKIDEMVLVSGFIKTEIQLLCSRCATPFSFGCAPEFSALFCKDPVMAGLGPEIEGGPRQTYGKARHAHQVEEDLGLIESGKNLDIAYIATDFIDLSEIMSEQLILQIPFQPLCKQECNGVCPQCGADLNSGRCACAKLKANPAFATLRNLKF